MLTGIPEVDLEILLKLDIQSLIEYSKISPKVSKLDASFWKMKMENDDLPFLTTDLNKTFKEWVYEYIKIENIIMKAYEILKIHSIEAKRPIDRLNLILFQLVSDEIIDGLFDDDIYENFQLDYSVVNILIKLHNNNYKVILEGLDYDNGTRNAIEVNNIDWDIVFNILVKSMYKQNIEVLDELSLDFMINQNPNLLGYNQDDLRILNKRLGIKDCLHQGDMRWY